MPKNLDPNCMKKIDESIDAINIAKAQVISGIEN